MTRVTKAELDRLVNVISAEYDLPQPAWHRVEGRYRSTPGALVIDRDGTGCRLMQVATEGGGLYEISPRLPAGQLAMYLRGMVAVADVIRHAQEDRP